MKNVKVAAFALFILTAFTRCTQDTSSLAPSTEETLIKNTWGIDYYYNTHDMTNNFSSSKLLFSNTGIVAYQKEGKVISGTWSKAVDASNNETITLHFDTNDIDLGLLNKSWMVTNHTNYSLQFEETGTAQVLFRIKTE